MKNTTVLIGQGQGTAVNGLYQDAHSHTTAMPYRGYVTGSGDIAYGGGGNYTYPGTSGAQPAIRSNDTETRSTNLTYKIWVRTA